MPHSSKWISAVVDNGMIVGDRSDNFSLCGRIAAQGRPFDSTAGTYPGIHVADGLGKNS